MKKRILAMLLACMMLVTVLPLSVFAADVKCPGAEHKHTKDNCEYEQVGEPVPSRCGEYGYTLYQCKDCGEKFAADFVIPSETGDHNWEITTAAKPATCTAPGCTEGKKCTICDKEVQSEVIDQLKHEYEVQSTTGNCLLEGETTYKCKTCDDTYKVTVEGTGVGHKWSEVPTIKREPTWNTDGIAVYTCTVCEATKEVKILAEHDHVLTAHKATAADCENAGNIAYWTCDICGVYFSDADAKTTTTAAAVVVGALGHDFENGKVIEDTSEGLKCDSPEAGKKVTQCSRCDETKTETVELPKHTFDPNPDVKNATCTEYGYKVYLCTVCGEQGDFVKLNPTGHSSYEDGKNKETNQPSCEQAGTRTWTCGHEGCNEALSEEIPANTHNTKSYTVKATCISGGYTFSYCTNENCDKSLLSVYTDNEIEYDVTVDGKAVHFISFDGVIAIDRDAHDVVWDTQYEATCTADGKRVGYCKLCPDKDIVQVIPAKGHTADGKWATTPAKCGVEGYRYQLCSVCSEKAVEETIPALVHNWVAGTPVAPTCVADGYTPYTCSHCKAVENRNTVKFVDAEDWYDTFEEAAAAHLGLSEEATVFRPGDCHTTGLYLHACSGCGKNILVRIEGTGEHNDDGVYDKTGEKAAQAPTCEDDGWTEAYVCTKCGELIESVTIPKTGHTVVVDAAKAPTCTQTGLTEGSHCSVCKKVLVAQTVVDAKGHTVVIDSAVAPTCTASGLTEGSHCSVCNEVLVAQKIVAATGHSEIIVDSRNVGCDVFGYIHMACERCISDKTLDYTYEYIKGYKKAIGHNFVADELRSSDPECEKNGLNAMTCSNDGCKATNDTVIPALGHKNAANETLVDSCTNNVADRECVNCKTDIKKTHDEFKTVAIAATCKDYGYKLDYCDACGYQYVYEVDPTYLADHTWGKWVEVTPATITEKGLERRTCEICKEATEERDIEPLVGLEFNMSTENVAGGTEYADSSLIAVTVTVTGNENGVSAWGMQFNVNYDVSKLQFVEAKFVSESFRLGAANDVDGYVSVLANTENDMEGTRNAVVTDEENVVVLYFRVSVGEENNVAQTTVLSFSDIEIVDKDTNTIVGEGNDTTIGIVKFMDINDDGYVSLADAQIVAGMITGSTDYDVTVDVNKDGVINIVDFMAIREYLIAAKSYDDMTNLGVNA